MAKNNASTEMSPQQKKYLRRPYVERAMEYAFDNDLEQLQAVFVEVDEKGLGPMPVESDVEKQNGLLSEAACGNAVECAEFLLAKGANPNAIGEHGRVPLLRALHNDAKEVLPVLLKAGADPRLLFAQDFEPPSEEFPNGRKLFRPWDVDDVNGLKCGAPCKAILKEWDFPKTLKLLAEREFKLMAEMEKKREEDAKRELTAAEHLATVEEQLREAREARKSAFHIRERRIKEYDEAKCAGKGADVLSLMDRLIKQSIEEEQMGRLRVEMLEKEVRNAKKDHRAAEAAVSSSSHWDITVPLGQLEETALDDVGGVIAATGKMCLVIDACKQAASYLTYRPVTLLEAGNSHHMSSAFLVFNLLSCLRFGKSLIVNCGAIELAETVMRVQTALESARPNLFQDVLTGNLKNNFETLLTDAVVKQYEFLHIKYFSMPFMMRFKLVLVSNEIIPPDKELLANFYTVYVQ